MNHFDVTPTILDELDFLTLSIKDLLLGYLYLIKQSF